MFHCSSIFLIVYFSNSISFCPLSAAKLGDTRDLESFIDMLDRELAGAYLRKLHPLSSNLFLTSFVLSRQASRLEYVTVAETRRHERGVCFGVLDCVAVSSLFLQCTVPPAVYLWAPFMCKYHVWGLRWTIYTRFSDNGILDYMSVMILLSAVKQWCSRGP